MSAVALTPISGKRRFDEGEGLPDSFDRHAGAGSKRVRHTHSHSPGGRCAPLATDGTYASSLAALRGLFPGMDEKTLSDVLVDCGGNIDAAIQRLGCLSLSAEAGAEAGPSDSAAPAEPHPQASASGQAGATSNPSPDPQGPAQHQEQPGAAPDPRVPQSAEQWVEYLVHELSQANSMDSAKVKAATVLQRFEAFVSDIVKKQVGHDSSLVSRAAKLQEENALLKKAVQIQHRQLQERAQQAEEVNQLRAALTQYQEQVRLLEVNNYSLTMHLQKATGGMGFQTGHRNPDVF